MKYTLRFLILSVCLFCSISVFADSRGADLFKPASNATSPSQWTNANSGNSFSYSRRSSYYSGGGYSVGSSNGIYGSSTSTSVYGSDRKEVQYATDDFLDGGQSGQQRVRGRGNAGSGGIVTPIFDLYQDPPITDALPCLSVLAIVFILFKSRKKIATLISHRN